MTLANKLMSLAIADGAPPGDDTLYVEDVFEIVTWTGNATGRVIPTRNDITDGTWVIMVRSLGSAVPTYIYAPHIATDRFLDMSSTGVGYTQEMIGAFYSTGFWVTSNTGLNANNGLYAAWLFKITPKFFTRITYTGTGANRAIAHDLDCLPGMLWIKGTTDGRNWVCYNRGVAAGAGTHRYYGNGTAAPGVGATFWNDTAPTTSDFSLGTHVDVNASGETYVAYLFAHDDSPEGIIQCGGKTYDSNGIITLGWEPQLVYTRRIDSAQSTFFTDVMNGFQQIASDSRNIHLNSATTYAASSIAPTVDGFDSTITTGQSVIFMAIRRGLMRVPTDATKVFDVNLRVGTGAQAHFPGPDWPVDLWWCKNRGGGTGRTPFQALRLRGVYVTGPSTIEDYRMPATTGVNALSNSKAPWRVVAEIGIGAPSAGNESGVNHVDYFFRRAKGFCEIMTYTGTGAVQTIPHKLGVLPDFILVKRATANSTGFGLVRGYPTYGVGVFGSTGTANSGYWNDTDPTATELTVGSNVATNAASSSYIACLFASIPGVCKIGTYVSDGLARDIEHGFAATPRFVLIKSVTATTSAAIFDSERGINAGANEPQIQLSTTNAESSVAALEPTAGVISLVAGESATNVSGRTYMYMFIA